MTKEQKRKYKEFPISGLLNKKFKLDCGHHVTFGTNLGNNVMILNGKRPAIICTECGT